MMIVWLAIGACLAAVVATAPLRWAAAVVVFTLPLAGTAVLMLGAEPLLLPLVVTLGFLARHGFSLLIPNVRAQFMGILVSDLPMVGFVVYCVVSGALFPKLFAGATLVTPQAYGMPTPLSAANISYPQIIYLFAGAYLYLALRQTMMRVGMAPFMYALIAQAAVFGGIGLVQAGLGLGGIQLPLGWILNNQGYAILSGNMQGGFARVNSVFVEASSFAVWGTGMLAFCYALFVSGIRPILMFCLTCMLGVVLLLSTSSTAYAGILFVGAFALILAMLDSDTARRDRGLILLAVVGLLGALAAVVVFSADSGFAGQLRAMIETMTVGKSTSWSAYERSMWARMSVQNALDTWMLGIGYGAGRGSGIFTTLFGLIGAPGMILFAMVMAPLVMRAFKRPKTGEEAVMSSGALALAATLAAMGVASPDLSLSNIFWVFLAVAAAPLAHRVPQPAAPSAPPAVAGRPA
ncbi:MAG: hypothetical protein ABW199_12525 [Caulobacterales bacterium]